MDANKRKRETTDEHSCFAKTDNTDVRAEQGAGKKNNHGAHRVIARRKKKGSQRREEYENPQMTKLKEL